MVFLKHMFSGFKKQMRQAFVPRARVHVRGEAAIVYRRWLGIDICVSEKTSARLLPSLLHREGQASAMLRPHVHPLARTARVVPRRGLGLGFAEQPHLSPLDLLKQGARSALSGGVTNLARAAVAQTLIDPSLETREAKLRVVDSALVNAHISQTAIVSDTMPLSDAERRYITSMREKTTYGGTPELYALSQLLGKAISVYELMEDGSLKRSLLFAPERKNGELAVRLSHMGSSGAQYDPIRQSLEQDHLLPADAAKVDISSVPGDGQCLWNAIGSLVGQEPGTLRMQTVDYLVEHARDRPAYLGGERTLLEDAAGTFVD